MFVQIVGTKKVYFKEFGDPRVIDRRTGEIADKKLDKKFHANELYHWLIPTLRKTPYGMPRYTGNIITIKGSRQGDETNILTLANNNMPSMAILVNGGMLTEGSLARIQDFVDTQIKGSSNYSKFLLLEGESAHDSLTSQSNFKIEIKPLSRSQHTDQLWQEYDSNNASKIRRTFRVAPILVGASDKMDRATAATSESLTEKYVYNPEREAMDEEINKIFLKQGIRFWTYKSNTPNVTNDQDLVKILTGAEKTGGLTPRIARLILSDVLNMDLPEVDENIPEQFKAFFHPDIPFSLSLAMLMHSIGAANQNGTFEPQGQIPTAGNKEKSELPSAEKIFEEMTKNPSQLIDEALYNTTKSKGKHNGK